MTAYAVFVQTCPCWSNVIYEQLTLYKLLNIVFMVKGQFQRYLDLAFHQGCSFIDAYCRDATNLVDGDWGISKRTFVTPGFLSLNYQILTLSTQVCYHQITKYNFVISIRHLFRSGSYSLFSRVFTSECSKSRGELKQPRSVYA